VTTRRPGAAGLTPGPQACDPEELGLRSRWFTRSDVEQVIGDGTLCDAKSLAAYALLLLREQASPHQKP
jgi:hypothetical protein